MKNCLFISVNFPPIGGIGVQRIVKLIKYLVPLGYDITVLTVPEGSTRLKQDLSMMKDIPESVRVIRPFFYDYKKIVPGEIARLFKSLERRYLFPDRFRMWNYPCLKKIKELTETDKYDLVFINCPPFSGVELAGEIKKRFGLKVFLNLRDPFSFNNYNILKNKETRREISEIIEEKVFSMIDGIITVTPGHRDRYMDLYPEFSTKFSMVTNGYDEEDFRSDNPAEQEKNFFKIGYSGSFSSLVPLEPLLDAIYKLNTDQGTNIRLSIATKETEIRTAALHKKCYDAGYVEYLGFIPHKKSIANLSLSHITALVFADSVSTEGSYPGKVFEYFKAGRPILLMNNHTSDLAKLIESTHTGKCVNINNQEEVAGAIKSFYDEWSSKGFVNYEPYIDEIEKFSYRKLALALDGILFKGTDK